MADLITVRIPELPEQPGETLSLEDKVPVFIAAENKTKHCSINSLRDLIVVGDDGSYAPVYNGGSVIYDVPFEQEGTTTASIPSLAGKNFLLYKNGIPFKDTEYEILSAGGFKLKGLGNVMHTNDRFELRVFELQGGGASSSGGLVTGKVIVTANKTLAATDANKVVQIRGGNNALTITLPDGDGVAENAILVFESSINTSAQHKIQTQNGQYIYVNGESRSSIWMGKCESFFLYWGGDGWYVIDKDGTFKNLGEPIPTYKVGINQLKCDGATYERAKFPRLWEYIQTLGQSFVPDTTWNIASVTVAGAQVDKPYRGCFSSGDGSTTFRVPDLTNVALRGLNNFAENNPDSDPQRYKNLPGIFQLNEFKSHDHNSGIYKNSQDYDDGGSTPNNIGTVANSQIIKTGATGGTETRMDNVGVIWVINY